MTQSISLTPTEAGRAAGRDMRSRARSIMRLVPGPLLGLVVVVVALSLLSPYFMTTRNVVNVLSQISDIGIMAAGAALVIITGGIDLSVGAVLAASVMVNAWLYTTLHVPFPLAVLAGLAFGTLVGVVNGVLSTYARIQPFVATLATMSACSGFALFVTDGHPITGFPDWYDAITSIHVFGIPFEAVILGAIFLFAAFWLRFRPSGRALYAVGGNEEVARLSGLNVRLIRVGVYAVAGLLAAVAGIVVRVATRFRTADGRRRGPAQRHRRGGNRRCEPLRRVRQHARHIHRPAHHRRAAQRHGPVERVAEPAAGGDRGGHHLRGDDRPAHPVLTTDRQFGPCKHTSPQLRHARTCCGYPRCGAVQMVGDLARSRPLSSTRHRVDARDQARA